MGQGPGYRYWELSKAPVIHSLGAVFGMSIPPYMPVRIQKELGEPGYNCKVSDTCRVSEASSAPCQDIDVTKRDRFELLSAYLDGEVTPEERRMVLSWMSSDPKAKCLYNRLMRLRQGFREGVHGQTYDAEATVAQVFQCINYRMKLAGMAGFGVFVLGALSVLSGGIGNHQNIWRWASSMQPEYLEVALDQPAFPIPKAPVETTATLDTNLVESEGMLPVESEL